MIANYHTHTTRCNHANGTEREYIESAIKNGFKILGFSDHTPQLYPNDYYSHIRMRVEELDDYVDTLLALRQEYKSDIEILIGLEVEYSRKYFGLLIEKLKDYPMDYIIQGQHFIPDEVDGFYAGAVTYDEQNLIDYVDTTIEGMETGLFSYLAHPDLINYFGDDEIFKKHMARIVDASIRLDIPLEVNMLGFVDNRHYPCSQFFSLASEMGASFIMGCDAHHPLCVRQPDSIPELMKFLDENHITVGDNVCKLRPIK